ncbi:MAG: thiol reductase thioredoxin [Candidatus Krumholzibacteriota bacterium]|nr:thiol reductase thioredoxin [Candidatus Krumholzibacteriota bacterium]
MGFFKRLLGIEYKPGEPEPLTDEHFESMVKECGLPCFVHFHHLWCSSCQVMGGLLNEVGPQYVDRAKFFKIDVHKNPHTATLLNIPSVPTLVLFKDGNPVDRINGLIPLKPLKEWIEKSL